MRAGLADDPICRDGNTSRDRLTGGIEEGEVEREAHSERVDAATTRNQQTLPRPLGP